MKRAISNTITLTKKPTKKQKIDLKNRRHKVAKAEHLPKILLISTYPPRECGIATYTYDLKTALDNAYATCIDVKIGALDSHTEKHMYKKEVELVLNTDEIQSFEHNVKKINSDDGIELVMVQHEFGLFKNNEEAFLMFLKNIKKPIILAFHTVLPHPNPLLETYVKKMVSLVNVVTVMTRSSSELLINTYGVNPKKIKIIAHGTHLVQHQEKSFLKEKYHLENRKVISNFGFLGPGKSIETTLDALPEIIKEHPNVIFLIVGKTHPTLLNQEGEVYRNALQQQIETLKITNHVRFVNKFVPLSELLEYLQLSDCYVFTSKDPNQAVSGTFSYALSCGCPIISTPIPHATEVLGKENGLLFDFGNSKQLAKKVNELLNNKELKHAMKMSGLHASSSNSWENAAIAHAQIFSEQTKRPLKLIYNKPVINLEHLKNMTTEVGIIQFSKINTPDLESGFTLDDNARALIAMCEHYKLTRTEADLNLIKTYIHFILKCQRDTGLFLNYVNKDKAFTHQNNEVNLEDANGRAIWALGYTFYLMEEGKDLNVTLLQNIKCAIHQFNLHIHHFKSPRALAFIIKGLYFFNLKLKDTGINDIVHNQAHKLSDMYDFNAEKEWNWFEPYLTYANSVLPEALLYAWKATDEARFKHIAKESFDFLISKIFKEDSVHVISNQNWLLKGNNEETRYFGGEQPIDVAYTILALKQFNLTFPFEGYNHKMDMAFSWFLGNNHLNQIIYNPCTGGCHDGLEQHNVNLNQGAESTISYLLARLAFEYIA
ncbi:glycosyltransferase [Mariniflexile maritimum]|uniref:glycosyltransferase n=1 Tax=Mariniflexile maritimum TaxID=2682493 RepID=UPI0012F6578B|nr:glycosyltransferase [Mariniflexile maritimum]